MMQTERSKRGFAPGADPNVRPLLRIEGLSKRFGGLTAVDHVSLDIYPGEFFALLGPSGCGNITLLRLIAGFERPNAGRILLDGIDLALVSPHRRPLNMVFRNTALFPHLSVEANVAFGLKQEGLPKREIAQRTADMLAMLKLESFATRTPDELSGGERLRVALARALVKRPRMLLLDEPLAAFDNKLRDETRFALMELQRQLGLTFVIATHDQSEAMIVADRIGLMDRGRLAQIAPPAEIYQQPNSRWVAGFIGDINLFEGRVGSDRTSVEGTPAGRLRVAPQIDAEPNVKIGVAVRPEKMRIAHEAPPHETENCFAGTIADIGYRGDLTIYKLRLADGSIVTAAIANSGRAAEPSISYGDRAWLSFPPEAAIVLTR